MKRLLLAALCTTSLAYAQVNCDPTGIDNSKILELAEPVLQAASQSYTKMLDLKVNYAGSGDLSILLNPAGELEAIKFYYKDGSDIKTMVVTTEEFNQGRAIEYKNDDNGTSPLKLMAVRPPGINAANGGTFNFEIITSLDPRKTRQHMVKLHTENGKWVVDALGTRAKSVILHPAISFLSWKGTFDRVEFK